jgi:hypothetical protein
MIRRKRISFELRWGNTYWMSAWVPKVEEPHKLIAKFSLSYLKKEAKNERHRRKVSPFNCSRLGENTKKLYEVR